MDDNKVIQNETFMENVGNTCEASSNEAKEGYSDIHQQTSYENYMKTALSYLEQLNEAVHKQDERIHSLNQSLPILSTLLKDQPHIESLENGTSCKELDDHCKGDEKCDRAAEDRKEKEQNVEGSPNDLPSSCKTENELNKMQENHNVQLFTKCLKLSGNMHTNKNKNYATLNVLTKQTGKEFRKGYPYNDVDAQSNQVSVVSSSGRLWSDNVKQLNRMPSYVSDTVNNPVGSSVNNITMGNKSMYKRSLSFPTDSAIFKKVKTDDPKLHDHITTENKTNLSKESKLDGSKQSDTDGTSNETRKQRFLRTQEALKDSGLLGITMKTAELINKQMIIDAEIEKLKICTAKFLQSVINSNKMSSE